MKHDYHGKPASLSARLMRVARRYKREDRPEKAAELAALPKRELGEGEKQRLPRRQKRAVGRQHDAKTKFLRGFQKRLQLRVQQRLAHKVQVEILHVSAQLPGERFKLLRRHKVLFAARAWAEAAREIADICNFKIGFFQHTLT